MKVWILTSKFGQGHFSVAKALEEELTEYGHNVIVSDIVQITYPKLYKTIYKGFNNIVCRNSTIYNFLNSFGRNTKQKNNEINENKYVQLALAEIQPDIIITTWSGCARILGTVSVPLYVCITDVGVHSGWIYDGVQGYLVANSDVKQKLIDMGIEETKIHIIGIPVKKVFHNTVKMQSNAKRILIMGGGLGIFPWIDDLLDELIIYPKIQITVITGKNIKLYQRLLNKYKSDNIKIVGFTKDVHRYLAEADLLVSKPGGVSMFESIYMQTPFVAIFPEYKHEIENALFIQKYEIGEVVWKGQAAAKRIIQLLKNENRQHILKSNVSHMKQNIDASRRSEDWWDYQNAV